MGKGKLGRVLIPLLVLVMAFGLVASPAVAQPPEMVKVLIGFDRQPGSSEQTIVRGAGGSIKYTYHLVPAIAASIPEAAIKGLLRNPKVTSIEPDITVYAIDAELDNTWGVKRIGAGTVHDGGNKGSGVKVAIMDSGVDYTHPDLDANFDPNLLGYDFVNSDTDPMDDDGHGTHVAGTVAAEDNDVGVVGVAPEAKLYALKVLEGGTGSYSDIIAALEWVVKNGIQVTNNSYGSSGDPGAIVKEAFDNAYAAGVLHIAAAGNSGNPPGKGDNIIYPARWDSVIAVAATDKSDNRARWSSTGPDLELAAPGVVINSTLLGGEYGEYSGTSMASPHVAGVAALVIAGEGLTNVEVRTRLQQTADDLGDAGWDAKYGYGLVDADEAAPSVGATGSIAGTVTNASDGIAISGTTVTVDTGQSATTAADGTYTITDVPTGDRSATVSADGFESQTKVATVTESQATTVDFALNPVTTATTMAVQSINYATKSGKNGDKHLLITIALVDDLGNLVANASVSIKLDNTTTAQSWTGTATTGTDGTVTFSLKNAPSGTYTTAVTDVTAAELTWDGVTPPNEFTKE